MKYIASWSGGKDSTASIILAHEHNEPLDLIIFSEVMFDENISGELPEHIKCNHVKSIGAIAVYVDTGCKRANMIKGMLVSSRRRCLECQGKK